MSSEQMKDGEEEALLKSALAAKAAAAINLTLDPDTVCNYLILSGEYTTATKGPWQNYPERPERFSPCPQVLCKEHLTERHYFEVEWNAVVTNNVAGVGLAYQSILRKGDQSTTGFGYNDVSWYFGIDNKNLVAMHNKNIWTVPVPAAGCSRVGVYLDYPGGSLSFYNVSFSTLTHLYTFKDRFTKPLFPGLYVGDKNYATVCSI